MDYLVKCCKDQGIYILIGLCTGRFQDVPNGKPRGGMAIRHEPEHRWNYERFVPNVLNYVNPRTGYAWKDEPAMPGILPRQRELALLRCRKLQKRWLSDMTMPENAMPRVYGVDLYGHRVGQVPSQFKDGKLSFAADVSALDKNCIAYEIIR